MNESPFKAVEDTTRRSASFELWTKLIADVSYCGVPGREAARVANVSIWPHSSSTSHRRWQSHTTSCWWRQSHTSAHRRWQSHTSSCRWRQPHTTSTHRRWQPHAAALTPFTPHPARCGRVACHRARRRPGLGHELTMEVGVLHRKLGEIHPLRLGHLHVHLHLHQQRLSPAHRFFAAETAAAAATATATATGGCAEGCRRWRLVVSWRWSVGTARSTARSTTRVPRGWRGGGITQKASPRIEHHRTFKK